MHYECGCEGDLTQVVDAETAVLDRKCKENSTTARGRLSSDYKQVWQEGSLWGHSEEEGIETGRTLENRAKFSKKKVNYGYPAEQQQVKVQETPPM